MSRAASDDNPEMPTQHFCHRETTQASCYFELGHSCGYFGALWADIQIGGHHLVDVWQKHVHVDTVLRVCSMDHAPRQEPVSQDSIRLMAPTTNSVFAFSRGFACWWAACVVSQSSCSKHRLTTPCSWNPEHTNWFSHGTSLHWKN